LVIRVFYVLVENRSFHRSKNTVSIY